MYLFQNRTGPLGFLFHNYPIFIYRQFLDNAHFQSKYQTSDFNQTNDYCLRHALKGGRDKIFGVS